MKIRTFFSDRRGFTYVDLLVYMGVILILSIPSYQLISRTLKGYENYKTKAEAARNEALLYASIQHELTLIAPPWWTTQIEVEKISEGYEFGWYDGEEEDCLTLINGEKGFYIILVVDDESSTLCFVPGYTLEKLEIYASPDDIPSGWLLEFTGPMNEEVEFHIPMSRIAL